MNRRNYVKTQKICYICKEKFEDKHAKDKKGTVVIMQQNIEVLHIVYVI